LAAAARLFPMRNGQFVSVQTMMRRIKRGCRGVKLEAVVDGHQWFTTKDAIERFQRACTQAALGAAEPEWDADVVRENEIAKDFLKSKRGKRRGKENQKVSR
jgi:hypothetical protein